MGMLTVPIPTAARRGGSCSRTDRRRRKHSRGGDGMRRCDNKSGIEDVDLSIRVPETPATGSSIIPPLRFITLKQGTSTSTADAHKRILAVAQPRRHFDAPDRR